MIAPLLAEKKVGDLMTDPDFQRVLALLIATLLIAAVILSWLGRWRKRQLSDSPAADMEQFGSYRDMFERGELTREEYDRIRQKQARRLSNKLALKSGPPAPESKEDPSRPSPKEPDAPPTQP